MKYSLKKNERLKSRKLIEELFLSGQKFVLTPYRVFFKFKERTGTDKEPPLQFGVGVPSKNFKRAVDRNRLKRLTRETYRIQKNPLAAKLQEKRLVLYVFFIYTARDMNNYDDLNKKMGLILKKLENLIDENRVKDT